MKRKLFLLTCIMSSIVLFSCGGNNSETRKDDDTARKAESPSVTNVESNPLKNCYFGDLHLHTKLSADANMFGTTLTPEDSYKYAIGEEVTYMGEKVKRLAPLDFLAVTDHSEYLSVIAEIRDPNGT